MDQWSGVGSGEQRLTERDIDSRVHSSRYRRVKRWQARPAGGQSSEIGSVFCAFEVSKSVEVVASMDSRVVVVEIKVGVTRGCREKLKVPLVLEAGLGFGACPVESNLDSSMKLGDPLVLCEVGQLLGQSFTQAKNVVGVNYGPARGPEMEGDVETPHSLDERKLDGLYKLHLLVFQE